MATEAIFARGSKVLIGNPPVQIKGVRDIKFKPPERELVDATAHDSDAKEFLAGELQGGQLTFSILFNPASAGHSELKAAHESGTATQFKVQFPNVGALTATFNGIVTLEYEAPVKDLLTASVTVSITGPVTWSA